MLDAPPLGRPRTPERLSPREAERLYHLPDWGDGLFFVNGEGHVAVRPLLGSDRAVDLHAVVSALRARGVGLPVLVRFQDLLHARVARLNESFRRAIDEAGYGNTYRGVFPIKVNQLREVVEEILDAGAPYGYGLECGSKAELVAALPYITDDRLLICNGCKDDVMMRLMLEAQLIGQQVIPVVERYEEFELLLGLAGTLGAPSGDGQPSGGDGASSPFGFGVRVRLSTAGAGLWAESGGENSKFGISPAEILRLVDVLGEAALPPRFRLLHFHLGSQIAEVENVRRAAEEAARVYAALRRRGLPITHLDIGGGLGVSYEAGNPSVAGSINYTLDDYTRTVVAALKAVCDAEGVPHPCIVSESGRAVTAYHSVLVFEALGARVKAYDQAPLDAPPHPVLDALAALLDTTGDAPLDRTALAERYDEADRLRARANDLFRLGSLDLVQKAEVERRFWTIARRLVARARRAGEVPPALAPAANQLADQYLCNFSVFRSLIDHWAIGQRFPITPIHRLDERPTRSGVLVDLTCDSDGKVARFVAPAGDKRALELHALREGEPYLLASFLMGAYQDIMGDMHNLFGRVTEAHVYVDDEEPEGFYIEKILPGATVEEQLALVQYFPNDLERRMNDLIQQRVREGVVRPREGVRILEQYRQAFRNMTYLADADATGEVSAS